MQILNPQYAAEPIGNKWYVWSGDLDLLIHTERGPVDAVFRLITTAIEFGDTEFLGAYVIASQTGFDIERAAYFTPTRKFAENCGFCASKLIKNIPLGD